jgi:hypothetical protein
MEANACSITAVCKGTFRTPTSSYALKENHMLNRFFFVVTFVMILPTLSWADSAVLSAAPGRNVYLRVNEQMVSPSGNVVLVMQSDGNLVTYKSNCVGNPACAVWNSQTARAPGSYFLAMQEDGNLVIYRGTPQNNQGVVWNSQSPGSFGNYFLTLQDDENLVIYRGTGPRDNKGAVWSTKTGLLAARQADNSGRVALGWMNLTPCSRVEWRQIYNSTAVTAEQRLYGYAYVDQAALNSAKMDIEQCLVQAVGACGLASLTASPAACLPTFKVHFGACLKSRNVTQTVVNSVRLSAESECMW